MGAYRRYWVTSYLETPMADPKILNDWAAVKKSTDPKYATATIASGGPQDSQEEMVTQDWSVDRNTCYPQTQLHLVGYRAPKTARREGAPSGNARAGR
jgi:hypothetical protein